MTNVSGLPIERGLSFTGSVYRDRTRLLLNSTNDTAIADGLLVAKATVDDALAAARAGTPNGYVEMGPVDGLKLHMAGAGSDNNTINYRVSGLSPIVELVNGVETIVAYMRESLAEGVATLGNQAVGAVAAAVTGLESTDLWVDTFTLVQTGHTTTFFTQSQDGLHVVQDGGTPTNGFAAKLMIPTAGCAIAHIETDRATGATAARVFGRRVQAWSFPGKAGGG